MNNCEQCSWYVDREKTEQEGLFAKSNPMCMIETRFCTLGGCDGTMFLDKDRPSETKPQ